MIAPLCEEWSKIASFSTIVKCRALHSTSNHHTPSLDTTPHYRYDLPMHTADFDYHLPPERIAHHSVEPRDHAKLLVLHRNASSMEDKHVFDLPTYLEAGDVLVLNDSKVFRARFFAQKANGARIELLFHKPIDEYTWEVLAKPAKKLHEGEVITLDGGASARIKSKDPLAGTVTLTLDLETEAFFAYSDIHGDVPTPPYVRATDATKTGYQTIYAKHTGSVAAPTAGLHITDRLLEALQRKGVHITYVTLHVGIGTFRPMQDGSVQDHVMHKEWAHVPAATASAIHEAKAAGKRVIAIGTTATRALEGAAQHTETLDEWSGWTNIFITPGYTFRVIDGLMTNFHLPKSTLLVLVSALLGREHALAAYAHAIERDYRFYSFGDAMLII